MGNDTPPSRAGCTVCGAINPPESKFCGSCGVELGPAPPNPGDIIADRYRLVASIGSGAMGSVYRAEHVQMSKVVAIKLLHPDVEQNAESVARFHREAEAASRLNHPNTVHVFDFGRTKSGSLYLVMEYVDGEDLSKIIDREGPMAFGRVASVMAQVAASAADAHLAGIVHRDLKPENIMIAKGRDAETAKVLDFGLAKLFEGTVDAPVTSSGTIVGTPHYMSPEQIQGQELDGRSDVYAMGAIMYECVVGKPPFEAPNPVGILSKHLSEEPLRPSARSPQAVPPEADEIIMRCLEKEPARRYPSADELRRALLRYLRTVGGEDGYVGGDGAPELASPKRRAWRTRQAWGLLAIAVVAGGGFGAWKMITRNPSEREPNHLVKNATPLPEGTSMQAYLGRRLREDSGDVDLFAIEHVGAGRRAAEIEVTSIPNMDVIVELLKRDGKEPLVIADSRGIGEGERLPNVALAPGKFLIRVAQRKGVGELPIENVSDPYTIRWALLPIDDGFEREPNDSLELAEPAALGTERRAWIGWPKDVDTFCLSEPAESVVVQVSALAEVDLVLRVVDRRSDRSAKYDAKGVGRAETSRARKQVEADELCVEVSADAEEPNGRPAQPDHTYGVRFITAPKR
jgi:serine/threonine-protein kinase